MLRITILINREATTLRLEGRLAGPWVQELKRCWAATVSRKTPHPHSVDLSAVTYIDPEGKVLLKKIHQQGAKLVASGCLTSCVVKEIAGAGTSQEHMK
jgi:anti-anti-sigma regulatory factor